MFLQVTRHIDTFHRPPFSYAVEETPAPDGSSLLSLRCLYCADTVSGCYKAHMVHMKLAHKDVDGKGNPYQCSFCEMTAPTKKKLAGHVNAMHKTRTAPCPVCGEWVEEDMEFKFHIR